MLKCDSIKLLCNFIEITLRQGSSPVNLLHISELLFIGTPLEGCFCIEAFHNPPHKSTCDVLRDLVPFVQFKNVKNTHGGVLLWVKLQATTSNTPPWMFFTFFKLYKWYQIAQGITYKDLSSWRYIFEIYIFYVKFPAVPDSKWRAIITL